MNKMLNQRPYDLGERTRLSNILLTEKPDDVKSLIVLLLRGVKATKQS